MPEPGKLLGKINWRINKGDEDFIERSTTQKFVQACGAQRLRAGCFPAGLGPGLGLGYLMQFRGSSIGQQLISVHLKSNSALCASRRAAPGYGDLQTAERSRQPRYTAG